MLPGRLLRSVVLASVLGLLALSHQRLLATPGRMLLQTVAEASESSTPSLTLSPALLSPQAKLLKDIHVQMSADRQQIGISDQLHVTLSVEAPEAIEVTLPSIDAQLGPFTVLRRHPATASRPAPGIRRWQQVYALEAERSGALVIPPIAVHVTQKGNGKPVQMTLQTDPLPITVTTLLPESADVNAPKDIAPPVLLRRRAAVPLWWVGLAVLVVLLVLGGLWWWRRQRRRVAAEPQFELAHVLALQALDELKRAGLLSETQADIFYVRLSDILRRYVEWRFALQAPEQTTEEFLAAVHQTGGLIGSHQALLGTFLEHCDLVKFARHQPALGDMQQAYDSARQFVQRTADSEALVVTSPCGVGV